jgi:hypothetical protein
MAAAKYLSELASVKIKIMAHPSCIYISIWPERRSFSLLWVLQYIRERPDI